MRPAWARSPRQNFSSLAGMTRLALFPYIGAPNPNPSSVPGGNPAP